MRNLVEAIEWCLKAQYELKKYDSDNIKVYCYPAVWDYEKMKEFGDLNYKYNNEPDEEKRKILYKEFDYSGYNIFRHMIYIPAKNDTEAYCVSMIDCLKSNNSELKRVLMYLLTDEEGGFRTLIGLQNK